MTSLSTARTPLCFVGYMAGGRPGFTTSQGFVLSQILRSMGWDISAVSTKHNRWLRLIDMSTFLLVNGRRHGLILMEVYGGRNFLLVDIVSALAVRTGCPIVMVLHGGSLPSLMRRNPAWAGRVLRRATALVAPSQYLARAAKDFLRIDTQIIPNVIDTEGYQFRLRSNLRPRLFWMRAFSQLYNPLMAIRVMARVRSRYPDATLNMAGKDLGDLGRVCAAISQEGLEGSVTLPGFLDAPGKLQALNQADIFINTSQVDNMPVAVMEACAAGLPVVSTRVGGIPDLITHEENGLLVDPDDDAGMAAAIFRLIEEPALSARLSENGRTLSETNSRSIVVPQWERLFAYCMRSNG